VPPLARELLLRSSRSAPERTWGCLVPALSAERPV
jgi:hypothetical protein